jgi:hypothetical protein
MPHPDERFPIGPRADRPIRESTTLTEWPHCPACGAARTTRCPACGTQGTAWEQAFGPTLTQRADDGENDGLPAARLAVICPTCDEVFRPAFSQRCEACGHDFVTQNVDDAAAADHAATERDAATPRRSPRQTARVIFAVIALVAVLYTLYDWLLSNTGGTRLF